KQKTAYEIKTGDWSSDVCTSDLQRQDQRGAPGRRRGRRSVCGDGSGRCGRRSEERRVGKECRLLWRSRWSAYYEKKKIFASSTNAPFSVVASNATAGSNA